MPFQSIWCNFSLILLPILARMQAKYWARFTRSLSPITSQHWSSQFSLLKSQIGSFLLMPIFILLVQYRTTPCLEGWKILAKISLLPAYLTYNQFYFSDSNCFSENKIYYLVTPLSQYFWWLSTGCKVNSPENPVVVCALSLAHFESCFPESCFTTWLCVWYSRPQVDFEQTLEGWRKIAGSEEAGKPLWRLTWLEKLMCKHRSTVLLLSLFYSILKPVFFCDCHSC